MPVFAELSIIIFVATILAFVMRLLKQPLVVGYILSGIIVGPGVLNILQSSELIEIFSKIGITILLFIVGLNLNPKVIAEIGKTSVIGGLGQVLFTTLIGFILALILGLDRTAALYVSIAFTFSSTIIILKLLSDKGDLYKLYGKLSVGFLLVQDLIATIILIAISSLGTAESSALPTILLGLVIKSVLLLIVLYVISEYVLPSLSEFVAASPELLFLFSLSWGLALSTVFYVLGFSIEIGALVAGVTLAVTPFAHEIGARLKPLRDFFIVLFFILLGSQMQLTHLSTLIVPTLIFTAFVLIGNPLIVIVIMNLLGFKRKTGFLTGLTLAQISEFSLILATLGFNIGHISQEILSLITFVGLITISGSSYFILYADRIYPWVEHFLRLFELRQTPRQEKKSAQELSADALLFGFGRVGEDFISVFQKLHRSYLVIDFNPDSIKKLTQQKIPFRFGDAEDPEFLEELDFSKVKLVVSTIPDVKTSRLLVTHIRRENSKTIIIVLSHHPQEAHELYAAGASYVLMPHYLGARYATNMLSRLGFDTHEFSEEKAKHLEYLTKRLTLT